MNAIKFDVAKPQQNASNPQNSLIFKRKKRNIEA